jgi:fucose permease
MSASTTTVTTHGDPNSPIPLDTLTPRPNSNTTTPTNQLNSNNTGNTTPHTTNPSRPPEKQQQPTPTPHRLPKLLSTAFSFFTAGTNDGSLGALLPYILRSYGITTALVSSLYAGTLAGWLLAALTATHLAQRLRLGSLLCLGAALQAVAHALRCWYVKWAF